jgi:hypothetical protein
MIINELKKRENNWDNRFVIEKMNEYSVFKDKHCENF